MKAWNQDIDRILTSRSQISEKTTRKRNSLKVLSSYNYTEDMPTRLDPPRALQEADSRLNKGNYGSDPLPEEMPRSLSQNHMKGSVPVQNSNTLSQDYEYT